MRACICVIANALYARKMIAILPPRGTYAAAVGEGVGLLGRSGWCGGNIHVSRGACI